MRAANGPRPLYECSAVQCMAATSKHASQRERSAHTRHRYRVPWMGAARHPAHLEPKCVAPLLLPPFTVTGFFRFGMATGRQRKSPQSPRQRGQLRVWSAGQQ